MSLSKEGIKTVERSYGDFVVRFSDSGEERYITIKDKDDRIEPTTFLLMHGNLLTESTGKALSRDDLYEILAMKAAERGYVISSIEEDKLFEKGLFSTIDKLREELKKQHPMKYENI